MAGLFDLEALLGMLGPGAANAAGAMGPNGAPAGFPTADQLINSEAAMRGLPPLPAPEFTNPNPVGGGVPLPRPNPLQPSPEEMAGATRLGLPGPMGNPVTPPGTVGAALTGGPIPGAEGPTSVGGAPLTPPSAPTDVSAQRKTEPQRPTLAEALRGAKAPPGPEMQKISTPAAPRPTGTIKGGDLQALLMALNAGTPAFERKLPTTLGRG